MAQDAELLLAEAARPLFDARETDAYPLLALRQGGLRDDLLAVAAARGVKGWFSPPICVFHELPRFLGHTARVPCDDFERAVIQGGILRKLAGDVFGRRLRRPQDFLHALDRLIGELVAEGTTPAEFARAVEFRAGRDEFERSRDHELALIYEAYCAALIGQAPHRRDGRDVWLDCAQAIARDPAALARRLEGRREIRLYGLNDLRGGWRTMLAALAVSPAIDRVVVYSAERLDFGQGIDVSVTELDARHGPAGRLFGGAGNTAAGVPVTLIAAPDVEREVEDVARRVRALADAGTPLRRIAVIARQARPYVDLALGALERCGVPATARRRIGLHEIPVVRAVQALLAAAADGWSRHALVEVAEQPYFASELDAAMLNFAGFRRRISGLASWKDALRELHAESRHEEARPADEQGERRDPLPPASRIATALAGFDAFAARAHELDATRTLSEWVGWLEQFLTTDPWGMADRVNAVPNDRFDVGRLDLAGRKALLRVVMGWKKALGNWSNADDRLPVHEFSVQLTELLQGDAAFWTPTQRGVQVLEAHAAVYRSFDHSFLIGMEAGQFPLRSPVSPILDEGDRKALAALGLAFEPREAWEHRERELFRSLVTGARRSLTVSYSRLDNGGREMVRSAFVDELAEVTPAAVVEMPTSGVLIGGVRLFRGAGVADRARHAFAVEQSRRSGAPSPYNGAIEDPTLLAWLAQSFGDEKLWSPTQLESFAKCPWSYLSSRLLRLAKLGEPDEEMDAMTRGTLLHDALRRFYSGEFQRTGQPVFPRGSDLARLLPLMEQALGDALADARGRLWLGHPALQDAKRGELQRLLRRYLEFEVAHNDRMFNNRTNSAGILRTGVTDHELAFDGLVLERGGVKFRFRGSIDRVEVGVDDRAPTSQFIAAVDYKTTKYAAPGGGWKGNKETKHQPWDDGVVLQIPLYAYALTQLRPNATVARVEYRAIKQRETVHSLELYGIDRKTHEIDAGTDAQARLESALDAVAEHVKRARRGEFPAAPPESCGCPSFCASIEICRVPGGPRVASRR